MKSLAKNPGLPQWCVIVLSALAIIFSLETTTKAEPLWVPLSVYGVVAGGDYHSTFIGQQYVGVVENNPLGKWATGRPKTLVGVGIAAESSAVALSYFIWGKKHPIMFRLTAYSIAAVRTVIVLNNYEINNDLKRRNAPKRN